MCSTSTASTTSTRHEPIKGWNSGCRFRLVVRPVARAERSSRCPFSADCITTIGGWRDGWMREVATTPLTHQPHGIQRERLPPLATSEHGADPAQEPIQPILALRRQRLRLQREKQLPPRMDSSCEESIPQSVVMDDMDLHLGSVPDAVVLGWRLGAWALSAGDSLALRRMAWATRQSAPNP